MEIVVRGCRHVRSSDQNREAKYRAAGPFDSDARSYYNPSAPGPEAGPVAAAGAAWAFPAMPVFAPAPVLPPMLAMGQLDVPLEHEADRIADEVLRMPLASPAAPQVDRKPARARRARRPRWFARW